MKRFTTVLFCFAAFLALALLASDANAYQRYNSGCQTCHGAFTGSTSPKGTVFPSGSKHEMHRASSAMATDCDLCHRSDDSRNPFLNSSNGTANNTGSGCTGCHNGAGLRAHHAGNGVSVCAGCHGAGTIPAENVKPAYYGTVDTKANNSCNAVAQANLNENWSVGDFVGLDNDGDGLTDGDDPDCQAVVNTPPVANPDSYSTPVDTALNVVAPGVLGNDTDANGDPLTAVKVTDPAHGTVTLNANGSFTYTPAAGYSGPDSFTYKANDGTADGNTATVSITVTAAAGAMSVTPAGGLSSSGAPGGPFSPSSQQYTLTNTGGTSINWTASKTQTWVTLSPTNGTLAAGATDNVTVSINSGANSLAAGPYSDTVTFTNTTNGTGNTTRTVSLTVTAAPDIAPPIVSPPTNPDNNATGVAVDTNVTANFSEPILSGSVTATSFILNDGVDNVVGTFSVNGAIVTFDPSAPLLDNTTYTATLTTGVTDLAGNPLASNYSWTFTTSSASPAPILPLESSGGGGCAIARSGGGMREMVGSYGFLILAALGMVLRGRVKRKEK